MKITVSVDRSAFGRSGAKSFKENMRQLPFATALALTRTVQDAQAEVRRELPSRFTLRNDWVAKGIRIERATKQTLEASIFSVDDFMILQEKGGTKTPQGRSLAVPLDARTNKRGIITAANRPTALRSKPGVFRATIRGLDGLWQRVKLSKKRRTLGERTLKLLYVFKPSVPIKARFGFLDTVRKIVTQRFPRQFELALKQAIRTAR